jgi:hypothetical protein
LGSESLSRYVKKDSLYVETFDEVEGAHLRVCSHFLKNFTVPAKFCGEKKTL